MRKPVKNEVEDRPIIEPPNSVDVESYPKVILYTAKGKPLIRKIGFCVQ